MSLAVFARPPKYLLNMFRAAASGPGSPYKIVPADIPVLATPAAGAPASFVTTAKGTSTAIPPDGISPLGRQYAAENGGDASKGTNKAKRRQGGNVGGHQSRNTLKRMLDKLGLSDTNTSGGGWQTVRQHRIISCLYTDVQVMMDLPRSYILLSPHAGFDTLPPESNYISAQREFLSQLKRHVTTPAGVPPPSTPNASISAAAAFVTVPHNQQYPNPYNGIPRSPSTVPVGNAGSALSFLPAGLGDDGARHQQPSFAGFGPDTAPRAAMAANARALQQPFSKVREALSCG